MSRYRDVADEYVYRLFYPSPVYVVSAAFGKDEDALSAVWVTPVSLKPPRIAIAVSPERYTYGLIRRSGLFAVNKLPFHFVKQMAFIGDVSKRYQSNKLEVSGLHISNGRTSGVKVIREADAVTECRLVSCFEAGDHDLMVGEVTSAYATPDFDLTWDLGRHDYASYVGSIGEGETSRRIFVSATGNVQDTRWPRTEAVAKRNRDHKSIEEAGLSVKGEELHVAARNVAAKTGRKVEDVLSILEEMRRQGLVQLRGRLLPSDFE